MIPARPRVPPQTAVGAVRDWLGAARRPRGGHGDSTLVTGLTLSSQRVRPGDLYAALPGARAHGATFAAGRGGGRRGRRAHRPRRRRALRRARRARARRRRRGRCSAAWPRGCTASPPRPAPGRGHRDPGQDHHHPARRGRPAGLRRPGRRGRHRRHPDRRGRREDHADHARGAGPARAVRGHARARRTRLRDGGLEPRAGHGPGRRRRLRRRRLHQPRTRPPRLPRRRGGVLRRQGVPVHPRARAARAGQRRRRVRPPARRRGHHPRPHLLRGRRRGRLDRARRRARAHRLDLHRAGAPTGPGSPRTCR